MHRIMKCIPVSVTFTIQVSDALSKLKPDSADWRFRSLEYSVILCPFIGVLGGLFFLLTALYIKEDRKAAEMLTKGNTKLCERVYMFVCLFFAWDASSTHFRSRMKECSDGVVQ